MGLLPQPEHSDLLVGSDAGDDAAVWRGADDELLVSTADFFGPLVDDPFVWGQIAATNAVSDIYAMGAAPLFGLNLVCWPADALGLDVLGEVLAGGAAVARAGGWVVAGGHTVTGAEPLYGLAVTGRTSPQRLLTLSGAQPGDVLVLTKALGTGIITTAAMRQPESAVHDGGELRRAYDAAVTEMLCPNDLASQAAGDFGATAATDITGFGLLGHAYKLCQASGVAAEFDISSIPVLDGAAELVEAGYVPGGAQRNLEFVRPGLGSAITFNSAASPTLELILSDPQTSGGMLAAYPESNAQRAVAQLQSQGCPAAIVGSLTAEP